MLRARTFGVVNAYPPRLVPRRSVLTRRLNTLPTQNTPSNSPTPIPPKDKRKQQVKLRPGPIKSPKATPPPPTPATQSSEVSSDSSSAPPPPSVHVKEPISLKSVKETTARDIAHAESHGILTPPPAGAGWAASTVHKAIQLLKFYFRGVKLIFTRRTIIASIHRRIAEGGTPLARWEFRLMRTQNADLKRLVPFIMIALILEEIIPLIVIWAPGMLPTTCLLPSQRHRIREAEMDKVIASSAKHGPVLAALTRDAKGGELPLTSLETQDASKAICEILRLSSKGFDALRIRRIRRHLEFLERDDSFLLKDGTAAKLSPEELDETLWERGLVTRDLDSPQKTQQLRWWLKNVTEQDNVSRRLYLVALAAWQ